jgi:hypothetical protein
MKMWDDTSATPINGMAKFIARAHELNAQKNDPEHQKAFAARFKYTNRDAPPSVAPRFEFDGQEITESQFFRECCRAGFDVQVIVDLIQRVTA